MFLDEFDEEKMKKQEREEGFAEGFAEVCAEIVEKEIRLLVESGKVCERNADFIRDIIAEKLKGYKKMGGVGY